MKEDWVFKCYIYEKRSQNYSTMKVEVWRHCKFCSRPMAELWLGIRRWSPWFFYISVVNNSLKYKRIYEANLFWMQAESQFFLICFKKVFYEDWVSKLSKKIELFVLSTRHQNYLGINLDVLHNFLYQQILFFTFF